MSEIRRDCEEEVNKAMEQCMLMDLITKPDRDLKKMEYLIQNLRTNNKAAMKVIYKNNLYAEFIEALRGE